MQKYSDVFQLTTSSHGLEAAISNKRIAGLIGVEGGHQLGNSIAVMRQYYDLGVRYGNPWTASTTTNADNQPQSRLHTLVITYSLALVDSKASPSKGKVSQSLDASWSAK